MHSRLAREIVEVLLTVGQGAFVVQLDGVKTTRGNCEPILVSWIDADFQRQTFVLGIGYETGKSAEDSVPQMCVAKSRNCVSWR